MPNPNYCAVYNCSKKLENTPHSTCQTCYKLSVCDKEDDDHRDILLVNVGCESHNSYACPVCVMCALSSFQTKNYKNYEAGEEHCVCPACDHDFGALKDLKNTESLVESLAKVQEEFICSVDHCVAVQNYEGNFHDMSYGWCQYCEEFSICYRGAGRESDHEEALLYNEGCREHDSGGYSVCQPCAKKAFKDKFPESTEDGRICPVCSHDYLTPY